MSNGTLSEQALMIASNRYFMDGEDWEKCCNRVGSQIAMVENGKKDLYSEAFAKMIFDMDFIPGGRIIRNAGRARGSLHNCYVLPFGDSIEEIGEFMKHALILWSEGGGVGTNLSELRPRGDVIKGKGGYSSGPISFLQASDAIAHTVECGGSRRAAGLACMRVEHPDIMDFIDSKMVHGLISYFNISVGITEEFLAAVEQDGDWTFKFNQKSYGTVKARDIWNKIIENMVKHAEPGLLNFTNLMSNNSYYFAPIEGTNPCGEAVLSKNSCCTLGSLVLPRFITGAINTNWKKLEETIRLAIRFLDDVVDCNKYALKEVDIVAHNGRRIGLGVMGLAEYLFAKKLRYGSPRAIAEVERLCKFIKETSYDESINLATEKGAFPKFDVVPYSKAHFVRALPAGLRMKIKEHGIRNVTSLSYAPTGTISLLPEVTSGIEPLFCKAYRRNDRLGERVYVHPIYEKLLKGESSQEEGTHWFVDASDLKPEDHFETQSIVQRHTDGAVSKCVESNTRISCNNGLNKIKDISDNRTQDSFISISNNQVLSELTINESNSFYYNGIVNGIGIVTSNGFYLEGTKTHRIKCLTPAHKLEWKALKDIKEGDIAAIKLNTNIVDMGISATISTLLKKDFNCSKVFRKKITIPTRISNDLCWWLGCVFADGGVDKQTYAIRFCQVGGPVLDKFIEVSKKLFGAHITLVKDSRRDNLYNASISSIILYEWMVNYLGFNKNELPELIFKVGSLMQKHFIEGLTLDGFISGNHVCIKTDKKLAVLQDLQLLCANIGIPTYINSSFNKEYQRDYYDLFLNNDGLSTMENFIFPEKHKQEALIKLINSNEYYRRKSFMFKNILLPVDKAFISKIQLIEKQVINSSRLYNIFHSIANQIKISNEISLDSALAVYSLIGMPEVFNSNLLFTKITKISSVTIETMDIEVENEHSYIANGFISHNTINMPKGTTTEDLSKLTLEYINDLKGMTVYVDGSREGQILVPMTWEETMTHLNSTEKIDRVASIETTKCANGKCEL